VSGHLMIPAEDEDNAAAQPLRPEFNPEFNPAV
jgi:hypothetical protein